MRMNAAIKMTLKDWGLAVIFVTLFAYSKCHGYMNIRSTGDDAVPSTPYYGQW